MKRILIVDDNEHVRDFFEAFAEHTGKFDEIDSVGTAEEALKLFEPGKYCLIILDIGLQKMSGAEVCFLIRQEDVDVNIVAITGHSVLKEQNLKNLAGFDEVFLKTIDYKEFLDYIKNV